MSRPQVDSKEDINSFEQQTIYGLPSPEGLDALISALKDAGFDVIGPSICDQTIVLGPIASSQDLPHGMGDQQEKGRYRLVKGKDRGFFGYNLGPKSWKSYLFPERRRLWQLKPDGEPEDPSLDPSPLAFFGVRACELAAIAVQDRIFIREDGDPYYKRRREELMIVGVHCRTAAPTCFCPSMGTGPEFPAQGWDLLLTEDDDHFLIEAATAKGQAILANLPLSEAPLDANLRIARQLTQTKQSMVRQMEQQGIKELIYNSLSSTRWDEIGSRCLACANCTLVCPTCFCSTIEDVSDVEGTHAERWQKWDSCFHIDFSYVHGGSRRITNAARYRQWFSHKLASWYDQFGSSGCVGCGRCITWCPVGIDITEEMLALREDANRVAGMQSGK